MIKYLLDTDTCIYWLNGKTAVRNKLLAVNTSEIAICEISFKIGFNVFKTSSTNLSIIFERTIVKICVF